MKRKRRINYANVNVTVVDKKKNTKTEPHKMRTDSFTAEKVCVIGDTALEAMMFPQAFYNDIRLMYEEPIIIRIDFVQVIKYLSKTNSAI